MREYTIDVKNKILGRMASDVAVLLRGKNETDFAPNIVPGVKVKILNINEIKISGKKDKQKGYKNYSGYPGGLRITMLEDVVEKKGKSFIFRKAVMGMLPKNKLRKQLMDNLIISSE